MGCVRIFKRNLFLISFLVFITACSGGGEGSATTINFSGKSSEIEAASEINEGNDGSITSLDIPFVSPISGTITFETFSITAAEKSDFIDIQGEMDVVQGQQYSISVDIYGDKEIEGNELIGLSIRHEGEEVLQAYGRILNDDYPAISIASTTVLEGDIGTSILEFVFTLEEDIVDPYSFAITSPEVPSTQQERYATPGEDFQLIDTIITFEKGINEISLSVVVIADHILELDEWVLLEARPAKPDSQSSVAATAKGLIQTDDTTNALGFTLSALDSSQDEGSRNEDQEEVWTRVVVPVTVVNSQNINQAQNIQIEILGESAYGTDTNWAQEGVEICATNPLENETGQCPTVGNYTLEPDTKAFEVSFYVLADLEVEADEIVDVRLQNDQGVEFSRFRHEIKKDDSPELQVEYTINGVTKRVPLSDITNPESGLAINVVEDYKSDVTGEVTVSDLEIRLAFNIPLDTNYTLDYEFKRATRTGIEASDYDLVDTDVKGTIEVQRNQTQVGVFKLSTRVDDNYEGQELLQLDLQENGVIPIYIIDNDLPRLELKTVSGGEIESDGNLQAVSLTEEPARVFGDVDSNRYSYQISLENGEQIQSSLDFYYDISIENQGRLQTCDYLPVQNHLATAKSSDQPTNYDFKILIEDQELLPQQVVSFNEGESNLELTIEVNNAEGEAVECVEFFKLDFFLSPQNMESNGEVKKVESPMFAIVNNDKALLTVNGWESNDHETLNQEVSFVANWSQPMSAVISPSFVQIQGDHALACNGSDIQLINWGTVQADSQVSHDFRLNVLPDTTVEPDEVCRLSVAVTGNARNHFDIQYCDANGSQCSLVENYGVSYALGTITNNDFLILTQTASNLSEPDGNGANPQSIGVISWDKGIADNAMVSLDLSIDANPSCTSVDCIEFDDVHYLNGDSYTNPLTFSLSGSAGSKDIPLFIKDDNIVENSEQLYYRLDASNVFIKSNSGDVLNGEIINDFTVLNSDIATLQLSLRETESNCSGLNQTVVNQSVTEGILVNDAEQSCDITYGLALDKALSDTLVTLPVTISKSSSDNAVHTTDATIQNSDTVIRVNGSIVDLTTAITTFNLNDFYSDSTDYPTIQLKVLNDELVEIPETIKLDLTTSSPLAGLYSFNPASNDNAESIEVVIQNNDQVIVEFTQGEELVEKSSLNEPQSKAFPYTWQQQIAPNVPTIQIALSVNCTDSAERNCAEMTSDFTGIELEGRLLTIHTLNNGSTNTSANSSDGLLNVVIDTRIEQDEAIVLSASTIDGSTNADGRSYVKLKDKDQNAESTVLALSSTIKNDDVLNVRIAAQSNVDECTGFDGEGGCQVYSISWLEEVEKDVGAIPLNVTLPALSSHIRNASLEGDDGSGTQVEISPKDYSIEYKKPLNSGTPAYTEISYPGDANATTSYFNLFNAGFAGTGGEGFLKVAIEPDNFVEPDESLSIGIAASALVNDSISGPTTISHIIPSEPFVLTVTRTQEQGLEPVLNGEGVLESGIRAPFTYSISKDIAPNVPDLAATLSVVENCSAAYCVQSADYLVAGSVPVHTNGSFTSKNTSTVLGLNIEPDDIVERDEVVRINVTESSSYITSVENTAPTYTIVNEDQVTLWLTGVNTDPIDESTAENNKIEKTLNLNWDNAVSDDIGELWVDLGLASGSASYNSDFTIGDVSDGKFKFKNQSGSLAAGSKAIQINVKPEEIVELNETIGIQLSALTDSSDSASYVDISEVQTKSTQFTITNDDYVYVYLEGSEASETASGNDGTQADVLADVKWTGATLQAGLPAIEYGVSVNSGASTTSNSDYEILTPPAISVVQNEISASDPRNPDPIIYVSNDNLIEFDETLTVSLISTGDNKESLNQFVKFKPVTGNVSDYTFTIKNQDFLELSVPQLVMEGDTYDVTVCVPTGKQVQDTSSDFTITPTIKALSPSPSDTNHTLREATTADYEFVNEDKKVTLNATGCVELSLLTAKDTKFNELLSSPTKAQLKVDQNGSFKMEFSTAKDSRCGSDACLDVQLITIINDDLRSLLDTGLEECVHRNNSLVDVGCHLSPGDEDWEIHPNYVYQDAAETTFYPYLSYTYINQSGSISESKPGSGYCFQDNATGLIWSSSSALTTYTNLQSANFTFCAFSEGGWGLPSVQELMSIMNLNSVSATKPLTTNNDLGLKKKNTTDDSFYTDHSKYWSGEECQFDPDTIGNWTVDFINGHIECSQKSENNFAIKVYK